MKRLNIFKRGIAMLCSALVLSLSFCSLPVYAADDYETDVTLSKLVDIVMTAQGAVLSQSVCESVADSLVADVQSALETVYNAMSDAGETAWNNAANYIADCVEDGGIQKALNQLVQSYYDQGLFLPTLTAYQIAAAFSPNEHGGGGRKRGETYTLDEDMTADVVNTFQNWWSDNGGYITVEVIGIKDRLTSTSYFDTQTAYQNAVQMYESLNDDSIFWGYWTSKDVSAIRVSDYNMVLGSGGIVDYGDYDGIYFSLYTDNWDTRKFYYKGCYFSSCTDIESEKYLTSAEITSSLRLCLVGTFNLKTGPYLFSKNGGEKVKIYRSLNSFKNYSVGQQTVYFTTTYNTTTVNLVTYTGDYYCDNSTTYNYSTVQTNIDNSTEETITDSIVDSIVDESVTYIINNYYYASDSDSVGDSDSDSGSDSNNNSSDSDSSDSSNPFEGLLEKLSEVLGNVVGVLDDLLALALGFIVDAVNAILSMITSVIDLINTFREEVSGLSGALAEFFPYIPEDVWKIMTATITIICGLAIIDYLRSK